MKWLYLCCCWGRDRWVVTSVKIILLLIFLILDHSSSSHHAHQSSFSPTFKLLYSSLSLSCPNFSPRFGYVPVCSVRGGGSTPQKTRKWNSTPSTLQPSKCSFQHPQSLFGSPRTLVCAYCAWEYTKCQCWRNVEGVCMYFVGGVCVWWDVRVCYVLAADCNFIGITTRGRC